MAKSIGQIDERIGLGESPNGSGESMNRSEERLLTVFEIQFHEDLFPDNASVVCRSASSKRP
jgi:hypothetical protein